jgi:hypothetical protein
VATIAINTPDNIQFMNLDAGKKEDTPTLIISAGDWEIEQHVEPGIVFDITGAQAPMLTSADARKLAKWLTRAADNLDGTKKPDKKKNKSHRYEEDEDDDEFRRY